MPELVQDEAPDGYKKDENNLSSSDSSPHTPITTSTLSSPASLSSPSPQTSALFRILSESYGNRQHLIDIAPTHYPREQNLLDLLIQSSGVEDLQELYRMREIRLRIITSVISLSRLEVYTPNVKILRLDGSSITSLREIGTSLQQLRILHVSKCGLTSLDGTFGLTNLIELNANDNDITDVGPCAILENIKVLSLDRNPIVSLSNVSLLSLCPQLTRLSIKGSPVSKDPDYRRNVRIWMPYLKKLDGQTYNDDTSRLDEDDDNKMEDSESSSMDVSSMTGPSEEVSTSSKTPDSEYANCNSNGEINIHRRPATAIGLPNTSSSNCQTTGVQRPCSAYSRNRMKQEESSSLSETIPEASSSFLTSGGIFCGNIARALSRAKPARGPVKPSSTKPVDDWVIGPPTERKQDQVKNDEDDSLAVCDHRSAIVEARRFLNEPFPTKPNETTPVVELEMGVTGLIKDDSPDCHRNIVSQPQWEESSQNVLRVSKKWRKAFRLYRNQRKFASTDSNSLDSDET